jgi:hypothetical protein
MKEYVKFAMKGGGSMVSDTALLLVVEANENTGDLINKYGTGRTSLPYEREAIWCIKSWREHAGEYKDIPIYAINVNGNTPSMATQMFFEEYEVRYKQIYHPETRLFPCGYYNVPFGCMILEQDFVEESNLIHIDLDMYVIKSIDQKLFEMSEDCKCKIAVNEWRPTGNFPKGTFDLYPFEIATNFMYSKRESNFYKDWWNKLDNFLINNDGDERYSVRELTIFEERICDMMYFNGGYPFCFFEPGYQINHEEQINKDAYFIHCHLDNSNRFKNLVSLYLEERVNASKLAQ